MRWPNRIFPKKVPPASSKASAMMNKPHPSSHIFYCKNATFHVSLHYFNYQHFAVKPILDALLASDSYTPPFFNPAPSQPKRKRNKTPLVVSLSQLPYLALCERVAVKSRQNTDWFHRLHTSSSEHA
ncbi:hypothetical protein EVA_13250 [gut metagenome]|uniref:Uncharacterized protein n=1 Tax=gut metagenome TaxID=749906 RepID=J9FUK4_9ZZZZ